ncbi:MAG: topology modulation protein [Thermoleophilia bacterium]|nr:topology modulation protein [Thermoleophilia bacterium]
MERIVIVGCSGAGKSRLATDLSRRTAIPAVHLDLLFWRPGWKRAPQDEVVRELEDAIARDRWIVEGDFLNAGDHRFAHADAVVFLDRSRRTCAWRVLKRAVLERRRSRVDLPAGCEEGVDQQLLKWIWQDPRTSRPRIVALLAELRDRVEVHHLRSDDDVNRFLRSL